MYHLVVRNPFGRYVIGTMITDQAIVTDILNDPHRASFVVKTAVVEGQSANSLSTTPGQSGGTSS